MAEGFKAAAKSVAAKEGLPMDRARAVIAAGARKASDKAKRANPRLMKVSGVKPPKPERPKTPSRKIKTDRGTFEMK